MDKKAVLNRIRDIYLDGGNIISHIRDGNKNSIEDIMISYDFQAGTYTEKYYEDPNNVDLYINGLAKTINKLNCPKKSIVECGVGEATSLLSLLKQLSFRFDYVGGFDISWSRIKAAMSLAQGNKEYLEGADLYVADMFHIPYSDNSISIVYTVHAMEPNGGEEKELLKELYRVTRDYLILIEPAYEFADEEGKKRMENLGYITNLYGAAKMLGYNIVSWEPYLSEAKMNPLNPSGIMIIKKEADFESQGVNDTCLCDPITKKSLEFIGDCMYSKESFLAYPIIGDIKCLTPDNAVVAVKMME